MSKAAALLNLLSEPCICLDLRAADKQSVLGELADLLDRAGKLRDRDRFLQAIEEREATASTGLEQGVAIPHASSDSVREPAIAFGIAREGIEFGALDGQRSRFFLMIAEPVGGESAHLEILAQACCHLNEPDFRQRLLEAKSAAEIIGLFAALAEGEPESQAAQKTTVEVEAPPLMIAAVTSCPVGVSHTYMAAERLREAARRMGIDLRVETHGSVGVKGRLSANDIASANAVILAVDRKVDTRRFAGKPVIEAWVTEAISNPEKLIRRALSQQQHPVKADDTEIEVSPAAAGLQFYRHIMYGISTILPFVIAGGVLLSLADYFEPGDFVSWLEQLGGSTGAFGLLAPVIAGFIGRSISGRIALMPAMVGGLLMLQAGAGLLGGIVAGLLGGYGMLGIQWLLQRSPPKLETIKAILLYPVLGLIVCGGASWLLTVPMAAVDAAISQWLLALGTPERLVLGAILGGLMAVDLGGPINKLAFSFGIIAIVMGSYMPAAAVMAGGMVPPLALGLATMLFPAAFDDNQRQAGRSCFFKGICFVTEGVIIFARDNPWRVIPPCVVGAMLAGGLSMALRCELMVPHGGLFVVPLVRHWPQYCLAIGSGMTVTAILVGVLKSTKTKTL